MIEFLTDPVLRGPTWGCLFMCFASSLMGVLIFLRKQSLLSESLSHAAYPGACIGSALFGFFFPEGEQWASVPVLAGALVSSWAGLKAIRWLERQGKVSADAALCFVLAVFFGIGIVIASGMQAHMPLWKRQVQMLLFGQAATMSDVHIWIYGGLALVMALFVCAAFRPLQCLLFDPDYATSIQVPVKHLERIVFWLLLLALMIGIRSVGLILMSGMVIAPAVAARQFTDRLYLVFLLAGCFGGLSGMIGNYLSVEANLPTGPSIVLVGTGFALLALCFAPNRGLFFRMGRIGAFRLRCLEENILKAIWKKGIFSQPRTLLVRAALWRLRNQGWLDQRSQLTEDGLHKAASIIRLHRLWELYLTEELGYEAEKVHRTAEEMEHIITPEMEERLTRLLSNPKHDPHQQPIPEKR